MNDLDTSCPKESKGQSYVLHLREALQHRSSHTRPSEIELLCETPSEGLPSAPLTVQHVDTRATELDDNVACCFAYLVSLLSMSFVPLPLLLLSGRTEA